MKVFGVLLLLAVMTSCGKSVENSAGIPTSFTPSIVPADGSNIAGLYMARFQTLNPNVNGSIPGSATLQRQGDKFYAYVRLFGSSGGNWHQQNIHEGSRCPTQDDDLNHDGFIDIEEGNKVWGKILIPLDSNITTQKAGRGIYPLSDKQGRFYYERKTSFKKMFADLKDVDKDISDNFTKLLPDQGLEIEGKVFVAQGSDPSITYPDTVASSDGRPAYQTIPIVCGTFARITQVPSGDEPSSYENDDNDGSVIISDPVPNPNPRPTPRPTPTPRPRPNPGGNTTPPTTSSDNNDSDHWYDRVVTWWRRTWDHDRGGRPQLWGNGRNKIDLSN